LIKKAPPLIRFSDEALIGIIGLEYDRAIAAVPATADAPGTPARVEVSQLQPLVNGDFLPETPGGLLLNCVEKIQVFVTNQVVKTFEKGGAANARYMALLHRTVKKKFGAKFELNKANWYHPKSEKDLAAVAANRSTKMTDYANHLGERGNRRFISSSQLCGFPFSLDTLLCQHYNREDLLEARFFPPNTAIDIHITIRGNLGTPLRSLTSDDVDDQPTRLALRATNPRVVIDELDLVVDKVIFPEGHPFIESLLKKRAGVDALIFPLGSPNEIRDGIIANQTTHRFRANLAQLQYPAYIIVYWMRQQQLDGSNGFNLNTTVYKFVTNLDTLDIVMGHTSLLPTGGPVSKLTSANIDTIEKAILHRDQNLKYRRDPDSLHEFYSADGVQQYIVIPLTHIYAHKPPSEWGSLSPIEIQMGFTNDLSPTGWQVVLECVTEGQLGLRGNGSHFMINAAGAKIDGA